MDKKIIIQNRKAKFDYFIEDVVEAGIVLTGTEVKSLRQGKANLTDSYATYKNNEMFLVNLHISEYNQGGYINHKPTRERKLLLKSREIKKFIGLIKQKGMSLIPLSLYFNHKNMVKLELALAKGKKDHDKREAIKQRDWDKEKRSLLKDKQKFD